MGREIILLRQETSGMHQETVLLRQEMTAMRQEIVLPRQEMRRMWREIHRLRRQIAGMAQEKLPLPRLVRISERNRAAGGQNSHSGGEYQNAGMAVTVARNFLWQRTAVGDRVTGRDLLRMNAAGATAT